MGIIGCGAPSGQEVYAALQEAPLVALREMLTDERILNACRACGHAFRRRQYGPVATVLHFLAQALDREGSFAATWQELWTPLVAEFPEMDLTHFNPSALTHARGRLPETVMETLARGACAEARRKVPSLWNGLRLIALDASTVTMPREPALAERFGTHRTRGESAGFPLATFGALLSVGDSQILDYRFGPYDAGELQTCRDLFATLSRGELVLADRRFSGAPALARVRLSGAEFLMRKHQRLRVDRLPVLRRLGREDFITELRRKTPGDTVRLRIFRARWKSPAGEPLAEWFVTSLEDRLRFPPRALARLYHERWQIETGYLEFKQWFHTGVLRSKTPGNVLKEFAAHVLAYSLVRGIVAQAARTHDKKPTELSLLNAVRWVTHFSHRMSAVPAWGLPTLFRRMLDAIAAHEIDARPGRLEPRALARVRRSYPLLRTSRTRWRRHRLRRAG